MFCGTNTYVEAEIFIMTNTEIRQVLEKTNSIVNSMDKTHLKELLKTLATNPHNGTVCNTSFLFMDIKKTVRKLLSDLIKADHVNNKISRSQLKHIYAVLGDYGHYPTCQLCHEPIKINTDTIQHASQSQPMMFSWDHIKPKSMGGSYDLANMQPAHKLCNNLRGTKPLYKRHYKLKIKIDIDIAALDEERIANPKYRPSRFGLRKQDSWCHKQCCVHGR